MFQKMSNLKDGLSGKNILAAIDISIIYNLSEFEKWHEQGWRAFYKIISWQLQKSSLIYVDGELEKFVSYPDSLTMVSLHIHLHLWQKSTEVIRKKDEIDLYIKNVLRIAIKEIAGLNNDLLIADSSNELSGDIT